MLLREVRPSSLADAEVLGLAHVTDLTIPVITRNADSRHHNAGWILDDARVRGTTTGLFMRDMMPPVSNSFVPALQPISSGCALFRAVIAPRMKLTAREDDSIERGRGS